MDIRVSGNGLYPIASIAEHQTTATMVSAKRTQIRDCRPRNAACPSRPSSFELFSGTKQASAINFAEGLKGHLLIVHGSGDDNVHYQGTELLVNTLIELGKPFDFMTYPDRTHSISEGPGTTVHLYHLLARYLTEHLPAGPQ